MGLLIVAYPCYLFARNRLKTQDGPVAYWILANVFGGLALALTALSLAFRLAGAG